MSRLGHAALISGTCVGALAILLALAGCGNTTADTQAGLCIAAVAPSVVQEAGSNDSNSTKALSSATITAADLATNPNCQAALNAAAPTTK